MAGFSAFFVRDSKYRRGLLRKHSNYAFLIEIHVTFVTHQLGADRKEEQRALNKSKRARFTSEHPWAD
jgi:hypothetical protein